MGYTCRLGVSCCHYNLEILKTFCAVNLGKEDFAGMNAGQVWVVQ